MLVPLLISHVSHFPCGATIVRHGHQYSTIMVLSFLLINMSLRFPNPVLALITQGGFFCFIFCFLFQELMRTSWQPVSTSGLGQGQVKEARSAERLPEREEQEAQE